MTTFEDFEDGDVSDYQGDTGSLSVSTNTVYEGRYSGVISGDAIVGRTDVTIGQGDTPISGWVYLGQNVGYAGITFFGDGGGDASFSGYSLEVSTAENALIWRVWQSGNQSAIAGSGFSVSPGTWYQVEADYDSSAGTYTLTVYDSTGSQITSFEAGDRTYTSGGFGWLALSSSGKSFYDLYEGTTALQLAAAGAGAGTGSASLYRARRLTGTGAGSGTGTASVSIATLLELAAAGSATGTGAATLTRERHLSAGGSGLGTGAATLARARDLTAAGTGAGAGSASLTRSRALSATGAGSGTGAAALSIGAVLELAAAGTSAGVGAASLARERTLSAAGQGAGTGAASIARARRLAAAGTVEGSGTAALARSRSLAGIGQALGTGAAEVAIGEPVRASRTGTNDVRLALAANGVAVDGRNDVDLSDGVNDVEVANDSNGVDLK